MATLPPGKDGDFTGAHAEWVGKFFTALGSIWVTAASQHGERLYLQGGVR